MKTNPAPKDFYPDKLDKLIAYLSLLIGSILSASVIAAIQLFFPPTSGSFGLLPVFMGLGLQWLLVLPATGMVCVIYTLIAHPLKLYKIPLLLLLGLPLLLNCLAASIIPIQWWVVDGIQQQVRDVKLARNVSMTIKNETIGSYIFPDSYEYQAVLQVKNDSGEEITLTTFYLGAFDLWEYDEPWMSSGYLTQTSYPYSPGAGIRPGDSEIAIEIVISVECDNPNLSKPLSLLYYVETKDAYLTASKAVAVSPSINQKLQQVCGPSPTPLP